MNFGLTCSKTYCRNPGTRAYPQEFKQQVPNAYQERASMRGVCRVLGISRNTLIKWLGKKVQALPPLDDTLLPAQKGDSLESDEMWIFVVSKKSQISTWLCVSFLTGQVIAYAVEDRSADTGRVLFSRVPKPWRKKLVYSDEYGVYRAVVPCCCPCVEAPTKSKRKRQGQYGATHHRKTSFVSNNSVRQRLARFVRRTLSFSKCPKMHGKALLLFLQNYNQDINAQKQTSLTTCKPL